MSHDLFFHEGNGMPHKPARGKWKSTIGTVALVLVFLLGLSAFLYPLVSNTLYQAEQKKDMALYEESMRKQASKKNGNGDGSSSRLNEELKSARQYNANLLDYGAFLTDPFDESKIEDPTTEPYASLLNLDGDGLMGYISIPAIDVDLPIYHGTKAETLEDGVGHLQPTSLPVGGKGTHAVLSAHTGVAGRKLFTDLNQLAKGDEFYIRVLNKTLAYKVDDIRTVLPEDVSSLSIERDKDYVTLVTCTPYGINDHRLLVRGVRTKYVPEREKNTAKKNIIGGSWVSDYIKSIVIWATVFAAAGAVMTIRRSAARRETQGRHLSRTASGDNGNPRKD